MGRRAKQKQAAPPSLEEFRGEKRKEPEKPSRRALKRAKKLEAEKKAKTEPTTPKNDDEYDSDELEEASADLFEDSDNDDDQVRPMFSDDEGDNDQLEQMNQSTALHFMDSDEDEEDQEEQDEFDFGSESEEEDPDSDEDEDQDGDEEEEEEVEDRYVEDDEEQAQEGEGDLTLPSIRIRIMETVKILENFADMNKGKSRSFYTDRLLSDICDYYGYSPFLAEKFFQLFNPAEAIEFFEANEVPRPMTIRTNTLKTRRRDLVQTLINRGVNLQPIGTWTKVGLQVFDSQVPIGATPEYLSGHYILQAASSFLPVMALEPQENERILDMAAAPGGKTTYISALMKDTGVVFANDANKARTKSLIANIHRLGCTNTIVCNYDARQFPKVIGGFDRVLLDAPCSGTGVVSKDPAVKTNRTEKDFIQLPHLQKQLLLCAIDSVDEKSAGATIVYSTCSVMVEENEAVVDYVLRKRPNVQIVDTGLEIGKEGFTSFRGKTFNPKLKLTRRYYPHTYNVDGFYVAKFKKIGPSPVSANGAKEKDLTEELTQPFAEFDEEADEQFVEQSLKRAQRKKGHNPRALRPGKKQ
ncbi:hypothetical protein B9G98_02061 [Wickerhamiella sorbophila]|uniref:Nucleolar protein 2 n=1 Tax=Wickerhamiella sorbophila TaxID=45607 RepID=A0A2T0FHG9_9ASCO|nr:hypothetical protein B9G98_02061 [Wickerhamiella sorbophila]PRT54441.1 hypothetical protein B9G98_02061 [Wickerhamiella sorbophila]